MPHFREFERRLDAELEAALARNVWRGVAGPVETVLLPNSYHMITVDQERDVLIDRSARFFDAIAARRGGRPVPAPEPQMVA